MSFIIVPQMVTSDTVMIWVAAIGEKVRQMRITIDYRKLADPPTTSKELLVRSSEWRMWRTRQVLDGKIGNDQNSVIYYQRVIVGSRDPLLPGTKYLFKVTCDKVAKPDGEVSSFAKMTGSMQDFSKRKELYEKPEDTSKEYDSAIATATTLPEKLPGPADPKPFTVMLGSCFYLPSDPDGLAGRTYVSMPPASRPDLKILCGDQVYLDNPWKETTANVRLTFSPKEDMRQLFFKKYVQTWTQMTRENDKTVGGFNALLRHGANYFASDDHEFWNNAPNLGLAGLALTLVLGQRRFWFREGAELFRVFQSLSPWMTFDVPPISFCIADTRINRNIKGYRFMENDDLDAIGHWIDCLEGPGVLSLGQPILANRGNWFFRTFDKVLADFEGQYKALTKMISRSKHSIVLLTGDVHFGRVAWCDLRKADAGETEVPKFVEVISSPLRVVDDFFGKPTMGKYEDAFDTFGTGPKSIQLANGENHFVTIEFTENDSKVGMKVVTWPIIREKLGVPVPGDSFLITLS